MGGLKNLFDNLALDSSIIQLKVLLEAILLQLSAESTSGEVTLSEDTLATLENINATISNFPNDFPDSNTLAKLEAIRVLIAAQTSGAGLTNTELRATPLAITASALPLPTSASTSALQTTIANLLVDINVKLASTLSVNVGLTNAELRAVALEVVLSTIPLASGAATDATLTSILNKLITNPATETTSAAILAKLISNPNVEATQLLVKGVLDNLKTNSDTLNTKDFATQTTLASLLAKVITNPATDTLQSSGNTILTDILTKIIAAPSTEAKQDTANTALATLALVDFVKEATLQSIIKQEDAPHTSGDKGIPMFGIRADSDAATVDADGDYTLIKLDEEGRVKVSSKPASFVDITGSITAVQATLGTPVAGGTVIGDVSRASNVMMFCTGTFSTINVSFEGCLESTGEAWFGVQAIRSNANTIETATGNLSAQPIYAWELSVNALARIRVRCTARTSGTQVWKFKLGTYATEPIPGAQVSATQPVSGSVTVSGTATVTPTNPTVHVLNSAASTNATSVKNSAGNIYSMIASNTSASARYLKLFNKASAPTVGTDIPLLTITLPANSTTPINFGVQGFRPALGIAYSITGLAVDNDTTAILANEVKVITSYI